MVRYALLFAAAWAAGAATSDGTTLCAAAEPRPVALLSVSLREAFDAAVKRSEVVASQQEVIEQAEERFRQATGNLLPSVNGFASRRWQESAQNATGGAISPPLQDQVYIGFNQPLFRGMREYAALRQSKTLRSAETHAKRQAELLLYRDVADAYFNVLALERDLANIGGQIELYGKRVGEIRDRIRIGRSRLSERLTIENAQAGLRSQIESLQGQIAVARELLAFQTGLGQDVKLREEPAASRAILPLEQYLARVEERPDVLAGKERVGVAEEAISIARGGHYPSLDLGGNYYFVRPGVLSSVNWDVTLLFTLPIFSGGVTQSQVRTAASLQSQAELALSRTRRLADQEIRSLYSTVASVQAQIKVLEDATRLSQRNYQEQSREYRYGLVTNLDVLQALTTYQEAQRALDRAKYGLRASLERLEAAAARI